ncbi:MAG TPA: hypothetical protein PLI68_04755 [Bacteroidia bacterium]|nr:hypothetical protein [Bacteroidia bacterium]
MNKKSKPTIYLAFIAFIFLINSSCKKYPDGPLINLMSKEKRIERYWYMEYLEIGGIDSTASFLAENDSGLKFDYMRIYGEREASYIKYSSDLRWAELSFEWSLINKNRNLKIGLTWVSRSYNLSEHIGPFWVNEKVEFRIMKLTKDELWLETTYNNNLTKVHFRSN